MDTLLKWLSVADRFSKLYLDKLLATYGINSSQHMFLIKICESRGFCRIRCSIHFPAPQQYRAYGGRAGKQGLLDSKAL